ncbi:mycofactocin biosynthesis glycosyltransferase MftF [Nocardioides sp. CFH 31398]|uniref:mycofactocin biosynthesis glycosyltransferase MftF n=1 Tax=Nocardioides sp. CFH 31398 TaxID=2919579 RepID=UPI001F061639|nr:mycofactocin biosynthesis glycosyltransferase MftF [Nocardioides sp. CFH 31398]MCH1865841.1 mycofactocin biosynthesis glycosyltransferase MftF [Nocardioides sp. CFH 31398]
MTSAAVDAPAGRLPDGFAITLSRRTRRAASGDGLLLVGGTAGSVLRLSRTAVARLGGPDGTGLVVADDVDASLARSLLDAGMADPVPSRGPVSLGDAVTVVVPAYDDADGVAALLAALPPEVPVVVVDDASPDALAVRRVVAARPGAILLRHRENRGPAVARNTGLAGVRTPAVCFCDADVRPEGDLWLRRLLAHLDDPRVGLAAPRITAAPAARPGREGWVAGYERARSSLDLGDLPAGVRPGSAVSYLPSACLVARTAAVRDGFDADLRVAEDVDLVWRAVADGWRARYDPAVEVAHRHRTATGAWLRRKAYYGTGAAMLAARHGDAVAPAVVAPWSVALTVAVLAQRRWSPLAAAAVLAVTTHRVAAKVPAADSPHLVAARLVGSGVRATAHQTAGSITRHHWPLALAACAVSRRARRVVVLAAVAEALADHRRTRAALDPLRYAAAHRLDDLAYGAGVWLGAWRARSPRALLPRWTR